MAERDTGGGPSFLNPNTLIALVALAGSVWFVSHRLTSTRPSATASSLPDFAGDQSEASRLWEDPFKMTGRADDAGKRSLKDELPMLAAQIKARTDAKETLLILPVLLPGGNYSEDGEARIRSRLAVESALGVSGYAPEDAEHVGTLKVRWPCSAGLIQIKSRVDHAGDIESERVATDLTNSVVLDLRFEWHKQQAFAQGAARKTSAKQVLVLWLNSSFFEDEPLLRLPLLLSPLLRAADSGKAAQIALIGPRSSGMLRDMLPTWGTATIPLAEDFPHAWGKLTNEFRHIDLYSATASAMDYALVQKGRIGPIRTNVSRELEAAGFHSFHNFAATDEQLAEEIMDELELRGADLTNPANHLVLISEWDTFYARMLSLTYAAELAFRQHLTGSKADFIEHYRAGGILPTNFHPFFYLRGLDGQTAGGAPASSDMKAKTKVSTIDDLRNWTPDANKAEGPAQFDYLGRLGDQIQALRKRFARRDRGQIKAIGVVGSDTYDTLLILQALRARFSDVLFFTTDLDARYWHPREQAWSRNLILASGYNLMLHPRLQQAVPPFRDSSQTAQFAAVLAALGNTNLLSLTNVQPRRFEIGKNGAVNFREDHGTNTMATGAKLHPEPPHAIPLRTRSGAAIVCGILLFLATLVRPLHTLTWGASRYESESLAFKEEDLGGTEGVDQLAPDIKNVLAAIAPADMFDSATELRRATADPKTETDAQAMDRKQFELRQAEERKEKLLHCYLDALNDLLHRHKLIDDSVLETIKFSCERFATRYKSWRDKPAKSCGNPADVHQGREILNEWLKEKFIARGSDGVQDGEKAQRRVTEDIGDKAEKAREASLRLFHLRRGWVRHFRILLVFALALACSLAFQIRWDTFQSNTGEPFSLTSGTSIWPAEILRAIALVLAVGFIIQIQHNLRTAGFALLRRFRLPLTNEKSAENDAATLGQLRNYWEQLRSHPLASFNLLAPIFVQTRSLYRRCARVPERTHRTVVNASEIWGEYRRLGAFECRFPRILGPVILYFILFTGLVLFCDENFTQPLRGAAAKWWNLVLFGFSSAAFVILTFITVDAALLCRWFIRELSEAPTKYPPATSAYFSKLRGNVDKHYLDEWIDLQLIAELTERVGKLVYYPSIIFFVLLAARNEWWDHWNWPWSLISVFILNLVLAASSVIILQNAARDAKKEAEARLEAKLKQLQSITSESKARSDVSQAEKLLEEIKKLRRGAFVPFWESPVLGAVLLPSGGTAFLQMFALFMGH